MTWNKHQQPNWSPSLSSMERTRSATLRTGTDSGSIARTILHPTDYSPESDLAFERACRLAREWNSRLIVLHVAEPVYVSSLRMAPVPPLPKGYRHAWESRLRRIQPRDPGIRIEYRLEEGDVADAILRVAREVFCDLIVMRSRERTWLQRLSSRSVAARVGRKAPCPVLTIKPTPAGTEVRLNRKIDSQRNGCLWGLDRLAVPNSPGRFLANG